MSTIRYLAVAMLTACSFSARAQTAGAAEDNQAVAYYVAHPDERKAVIQRCDANPDETKTQSECILARRADNQADVNDVKNGIDNTVQGAADFFHRLGN